MCNCEPPRTATNRHDEHTGACTCASARESKHECSSFIHSYCFRGPFALDQINTLAETSSDLFIFCRLKWTDCYQKATSEEYALRITGMVIASMKCNYTDLSVVTVSSEVLSFYPDGCVHCFVLARLQKSTPIPSRWRRAWTRTFVRNRAYFVKCEPMKLR